MVSVFKELPILHPLFHSTNTLWSYCRPGTGLGFGDSVANRTESLLPSWNLGSKTFTYVRVERQGREQTHQQKGKVRTQ